ncbi:MAG: type II toxin-antitoxin system RelE/ParE family toxin [Pedosphaera sp.]|nr:type II toxin-antitoxin system RelE/ParE family toxin [Pedosphaera sp.]
MAEDNPEAADRFFRAAERAFELLRRHPNIGCLRSFSVTGVRSWVIPDFQKYTVFYLPRKAEVQILAVLHGSRELSSAFAARLD